MATRKLSDVVMRFPAPGGKVLSINESIGTHWAARRRSLEPWRVEMGWAWKRLPRVERDAIIDVPCRVQVTIPFRDIRRRDPHNYVGTICKALVDQLVEQGAWPDDNAAWVTVDEPVCVKGNEVIVRLSPR